jgi:acyl-coenzyme A thioesterase PaaI-like protein
MSPIRKQLKKIDFFKLISKIPNETIKHHVLDAALTLNIPFNRWLGFHISELTEKKVAVISPERVLRTNHVGGAHACALALLGEYPAGLVLAQAFTVDKYRIIISSLQVQYHKQGRGLLTGVCEAPEKWPDFLSDGSGDGTGRVPMLTKITNAKGELVAEARTEWQVKEWDRVKSNL